MSKRKQLLIAIFSGVFALWILFLVLVPTFLAHGGLERLLNKKLPGSFHYQRAHLSWFKAQTLEKVTYVSSSKNLSFEVDQLKVSASLLNLLMDSSQLKEVSIKGLSGFYKPSKKDSNSSFPLNLSTFFEPSPSKSEKAAFFVLSLPFQGKLHLDQSSFELRNAYNEAIELNQLQLDCNMLSKEGPLLAHLACETKQKELMGSMSFNFELGGFNPDGSLIVTPYDKDLFFLSQQAYLDIDAELANLPCKGLDALSQFYFPALKDFTPSLLGDSLNLGSHLSMVKGKTKVELHAKSPHIDLKFKGSATPSQFTLDEASICKLKLTPQFLSILTKDKAYSLETLAPCQASIFLERLAFPLDLKTLNLAALSCNARFALGPLEFADTSALQGVKVLEMNGVLDSFDMGENATFHLKIDAEHNQRPLVAKLDAELSKLVDCQKDQKLENVQGHVHLSLKDIPSHLLAIHPAKKLILQDFFGPSAQLEAHYKGSLKEGLLTLNADSTRLKMDPLHFEWTQASLLNLMKSAPIQMRFNPTLAHHFMSPHFTLLHPFEVQGKLKKLSLDLSAKDQKIQDVDLKLSLNPFETTYQNSKTIQIPESKIYVSINEDKKLQTEAYFTAHLPTEYDSSILSSLFDFSLVFTNFPFQTSNKDVHLTARIKNAHILSEFSATLNSLNYLKVQEPIQTILFPFSTQVASTTIHLSEPTYLQTAPFECALKDLDLTSFCLKGQAQTQSCTLIRDKKSLTYEDLVAPFDYYPFSHRLNFKLDSKNNELQLSGSLSEIEFSKEMKAYCDLEAQLLNSTLPFLDFLEVSYTALDPFLDSPGKCSFHFKGQLQHQLTGHLSYELVHSKLQSKGYLSLEDEIYLLEPLTIHASLLPDQWKRLNEEIFDHALSGFELSKEASFHLTMDRMHKKRNAPGAWPEHFLAKASLDQCQTKEVHLKNLLCTLEASDPSELIKLDFSAQTQDSKNAQGKLSFKGHFLDLPKTLSDFSFKQMSANFAASFEHFPTAFFDNVLIKTEPHLVAFKEILGKDLDLNIGLKWLQGAGPLSLEVHSDQLNTKMRFDCNQGKMTLIESASIQSKLQEAVAKSVLSKLNPLLQEACYSKNLLTLTMPAKALQFDLFAPNFLESLLLTNATLHLDQIKLTNQSSPKELLGFFDAQTRKKEMDCWLMPLSFSIQKGKIDVPMAHLQLNNRFHLAMLGTYNLLTNENQFFLIIPHSTLAKEFELQALPSTYLFKIPFSLQNNELAARLQKAHQQIDLLCSTKSPFDAQRSIADSSSSEQLPSFLIESSSTYEKGESSSQYPWDEKEDKETIAVDKTKTTTEQQSQILRDFFKVLKKRLQ